MATAPAMEITPPYTPELLPEAAAAIHEFLSQRRWPVNVLELGAGWSTVWFAQMHMFVTSLEHDYGWASCVSKALHTENIDGATNVLLLPAADFPRTVSSFPSRAYDLVYIDCVDEQRLSCLVEAIPKVAEDGWIVVDDIHWDMLQSAYVILRDWNVVHYEGMHTRKTGEVCYHKTAIFSRG